MEIEFASNLELIEELHKRSTFAGVIIFSQSEHREDDQVHSEMGILTTATKETTIKMLEMATETMINLQE